jgi:hypothetical protein
MTTETAMKLERLLQSEAETRLMLVDSANADLERKVVSDVTTAFLSRITDEYSLYAVTLMPYIDHIKRHKLDRSKYDCISYLEKLMTDLLYLLHKTFDNSNKAPSKRVQHFDRVEFKDKSHSKSVTAHIHACFAVHPDYAEKFQSLLIPHLEPNSRISAEQQKTINFSELRKQIYALSLEARIYSLHITSLERRDFFSWATYCLKEEIDDLKI